MFKQSSNNAITNFLNTYCSLLKNTMTENVSWKHFWLFDDIKTDNIINKIYQHFQIREKTYCIWNINKYSFNHSTNTYWI